MWQSRPFICWRCAQRSLALPKRAPSFITSRPISERYLARKVEEEKDWQAQAVEIREGKKQSMLSRLEERGYIDSIAGERNALDRLLTDKRIGVYVGFDPTAPSLHVGHLLPLMALFWFYIHGYHSVTLLGGATAKIGDPTGRTSSREVVSTDVRNANMVNMHYQLKKLWMNLESHTRTYDYIWNKSWHRELANNNEWLNKLSVIEFFQLLGKNTRVGPMLGRDTVRNKMEKGDGMSFSEFSYPLMQAWDWWHMYHTKNIQVQIGGGDQYGNIVAGIEAVKSILKTHPDPRYSVPEESLLTTPFGFTVPLLTTSGGEKFGKSAGNAIWLDPDMTSSFDLYQAYADVGRYLKLLTFLPLPEVEDILKSHDEDRSKRKAQHTLAQEVLSLLHGQNAAREAELQHRNLFQTPGVTMPAGDAVEGETKTPQKTPWQAESGMNMVLPSSLIIGQSFPRVLYHAGLVASRSEGTRLCQNGGAYIGSKPNSPGDMGDSLRFTPLQAWETGKTQDYLLEGNIMILRVGKWKVKIIRVVSDAEFESKGLDAPGWKEFLETGDTKGREPGGEVSGGEKKPQTISRHLKLGDRSPDSTKKRQRQASASPRPEDFEW
ncbi:MAG: tyrosyl-tRNA synthetase [Chaenotheca gracillima]|nr:MAG: tyrosyl-tRNA synthetase [Chaenotheca gracillima]